jgi:hypothetical protein
MSSEYVNKLDDRMTRMARPKVKVGDVFQIPLPDGRFAYGRVYKDASVGIYTAVTREPFHPPIGSRDFIFTVGLYKYVLEDGEWPIVGFDPFAPSESEWPPPNYVRDVISGTYQIYHQGKLKDASASDAAGLEQAAVWDAPDVIDRIVRELQDPSSVN